MTTPFRVWSQRFAFVLLVLAAVGMIVLNRADPTFLMRFRTSVTDAAAPALDLLSKPVDAVAAVGRDLRHMTELRTENERLRAQLAELRRWRERARQLKSENAAFRAMLNYVPDAPSHYVTARVIADSGSAFVRSMLVHAGARQGVRNGQAAINGEGLVGRIVDVGERSARILLITDLNSRIPVVVDGSHDRAILAGDNSPQPRLLYLPPSAQVKPGDQISTSGHGGVLPPGLPIGVVTSVARASDGGIRLAKVRPYVAWDRVEHVRIVSFRASGLIGTVPATQAAERKP